MKKKLRNQNFTIILTVLMILGAACSDDSSVRSVKTTSVEEPDQILVKPRIIISENGITNAIIESNAVKVFEERHYTTLEDSVVIYFYNKEGKRTTTLTARAGEVWGLYENVDSLRATGNVKIVSIENNERMETENLRWIASSHKIYADGFSRLITKDGFEQGYGFEASDDLSYYQMKEVSGEIRGRDVIIPER